ncbi:multicopper oxidase-domain-containing protein [Coniella lustricola]|uniref:Multicopper oxidase-domain-containing protein n=1 Tax=Coniella lustricola TaxID=2025994 RepID=A0A2T3A9I6_9PEZI|nr:multicopper oxidase-domain-containing protein [Coniella lustricola]
MSLFGGLLSGIFGVLTNALSWLFGITAALAQTATNGTSLLGTLSAALLPLFLTNNPLPNGYPWGTKTCTNTNPYNSSPNTGIIRSYDFTITRGVIAPDGYQRDVMLVNGAFPGPTIEANWGDTIQVTLHNNITGPEEGTSLHWHGFLQTGTPWEDGVPGVMQCPVAPGKSYTYSFKAELYGTSWYHSHYSSQYSGGALGPIVVYGPTNAAYDIDLGPVMLTDWYHKDYNTLVEQTLTAGAAPVRSDNNLINGKMNFNCSSVAAGDTTKCTNNAGVSKFKLTYGKTHRMRLVNAGSEAVQRFSLDGHTLTVIANDYVPVQPYQTKVVTLGVGQRADVLVTANVGTASSSYWMRSNITSCSNADQPYAVAAVYYSSADTSKAPASTAWNVPDPGTCANDALSTTVPMYTITPPTPSYTHTYNITLFTNGSGVTLWDLDDGSARVDYNAPTLLSAQQGVTTFDAEANLRTLYTNSSVRMIVENNTPAAHPMHLHGFNMYVLAEGTGTWDGTTIVNPTNPQRRDVQQVRGNGYIVLQFDSTNPGVWPFHCHISWHASAGLFMQFLVEPEEVKKFSIPMKVANTCTDWQAYTNVDVVDQIDSGV